MRYRPEHKAEVHRKLVEDASRRVRAEGLTGAAIAAVMRDNGLTHGGFYRHFDSKDQLLAEAVGEAFRETAEALAEIAMRAPSEPWKAIVNAYLSLEYCDHPERGCPLPAVAPELTRLDPETRRLVLPGILRYKDRMVQFMPGRRTADKERAFFAIFPAMIGAMEIARILPEPAMRRSVLSATREFLLSSF